MKLIGTIEAYDTDTKDDTVSRLYIKYYIKLYFVHILIES